MLLVKGTPSAVDGHVIVNLRCPHCRHTGSFHGINGSRDVNWDAAEPNEQGRNVSVRYRVGLRQCPNPECKAAVYVVLRDRELHESFPPQVLDFDATALPPKIQDCLEEAVKCHSVGCYRASALMVRKTLEELCDDKNATGQNLKARIANLRTTIVISDDLLAAADELRILGNDAAHVEAQAYDAIEAEEVEVAVELTKELLKAVYQHTSLVARLRALKKP